jgi:itaconyl-CoA hydratase
MSQAQPQDFDPSSFPVVTKGNKFEDFSVGQTFDHHWGRTLLAADSVLFSTALCFWNPLYLNAEFAGDNGHPDAPVNPMLVLCTAVGLSVEDLSENSAAFLGVDNCEFHAPVYPGDTIRAVSVVLDSRPSSSRPSEGIVSWRTEVFNGIDELVLSYERSNLVASNGTPAPAPSVMR